MSAQRGNPGEKSELPASGEFPEQPTPRALPRTTVALWLIAVSMAIFFLPLYILASALNQDIKELQSDLGSLQSSLTILPTPAPEVAQLLTPLAQAQLQANQVNAVLPTLAAARTDIPAVMRVIGNYDTRQIALSAVTRADNRITLSGQAADDSVVVTYARALEQSNLFARVIIQSIQIVDTTALTTTVAPTNTIKPTATITPIPSATATPDLRDRFEPDVAQPPPIALGEQQVRNFYPNGDVDNATFLAKALHSYRVSTIGLAPGVDTVLTVRVGLFTFTNDDAQPGSVNSQVVFQNGGPDAQALITVTNRGQYGPDKTYTLMVEEVTSGTGTPSPTAPSPTAASQPTQTPRIVTATAPATPVIIIVTATPPGSSSSSRSIRQLPLFARMGAGRVLANLAIPSGDLAPLLDPAAANSLAVKFVILLELKAASP